ncbi:hypothetical protein [Catelliglobosispora koreensis]|uniref:hypothetical protein n=1 Tax=Catelliglobosispora koreensis TaxID=129052 RepID=UPI00036D99FF|nr:hypothetical protein [Catelliglobosispora koreensis]
MTNSLLCLIAVVERGFEVTDRDTAAGDKLSAGAAQSRGKRCDPAVLVHQPAVRLRRNRQPADPPVSRQRLGCKGSKFA